MFKLPCLQHSGKHSVWAQYTCVCGGYFGGFSGTYYTYHYGHSNCCSCGREIDPKLGEVARRAQKPLLLETSFLEVRGIKLRYDSCWDGLAIEMYNSLPLY